MAAHHHDLAAFAHRHAFSDLGTRERKGALARVTVITLVTMVAELAAGYWSGSLALTADGWHIGTHALALGGAVLAYRLSASAADKAHYAFGGWKIEVLTAYTSGLALAAVAIWLFVDSVQTLLAPHPIAYGQAMLVAVIGLAVNLASAWLLSRGSRAAQHAAHGHGHGHHPHHDHNFRAAYVHVLADALTSVLAIGALAGGMAYGWRWLDPVVALVGAAVIAQWSFGVLRSSARALVDATSDERLAAAIRASIESDGDAKLADLHVWQVGARAWVAVVSVVADRPQDAMVYRRRLEAIDMLAHVTVEVHRCTAGT